MKKLIIYLLPNINFITLKKNNKNYIYIYNNNFFFFFNINQYNYYFKKILNILELKNEYKNNSKNISSYLNNFLFSWNYIFSKKIIFSGKGFKIRKKKNYLFLFFNRSISII